MDLLLVRKTRAVAYVAQDDGMFAERSGGAQAHPGPERTSGKAVRTKDELRPLLADLESDRVERTTSTTNTDELAEAVCAFANDYPNHRQPGYPIANSYRNPVIAECMKSLSYVNRLGYGIQRAQKLLEDNGGAPAEFQIDDKVFLAIIRRKQV